MKLRLIVSREAQADIADAETWLRQVSPSLPPRLDMELDNVYSSIVEQPHMYPLVYKRFRRALLQRFPYSVFYVIEPAAVLIVGVVHQSRDDSTWKRRA